MPIFSTDCLPRYFSVWGASVVLLVALVGASSLLGLPVATAGQLERGALPPCSRVVGAVPCSLPPQHEPGCRPAPAQARPKVKLDVDHGGSVRNGYTLYDAGFDASDANKPLRLTGILSVPYVHYRDVVHVNVLACNEQAAYANFRDVKIPGHLPHRRQVPHVYQLLKIMDGSVTLFSRKYAVTEP
jgi:hypothetical protein